jgi:nucleotide-binding universal stress UspA family protein
MIPPTRVLATIDFSESSRVALTMAARLARACRAELVVLHAEDPLIVAAAATKGLDIATDTRKELEAFVASVWPASECQPRSHVINGDVPVNAILNFGHRENVDVIVTGSHGASGAERLFFGSTAEGLIRRSTIPLLVVPPIWMPVHPELPDLFETGPIVVGIDFMPPSIAAAAAACRLATALSTSLEAIHVVRPLPGLRRWQSAAHDALCRQAADARIALARVVKTLDSPVPIQMRVEIGEIAETLVNAASGSDDRRALLVLGHRIGEDGVAAPCAIANRVLTPARVPVLVHAAETKV